MKRPLAFVGFSMAITLLLLNIIDYIYAKYVLVLAVVLFTVSLLITKLRQARVVPLVCGATLLACLIFILGYANVNNQQMLDGCQARTVFTIVDDVEVKDDTYLYTVKTKYIDVKNAPQNIKLKLYCDRKINADYYENVVGIIKYKKSYSNAFSSYGAYADSRYVSASLESYAIALNNNEKPLNYYVLKARQYIKNSITLYLKNDTGALCYALLTGNKTLLSDKAYSNFKTCGATHIMAVSGLHTAVICMGFYLLLKNIGVKRNIRTLLSLLVLLFYVALTDFSVSVIRSSIMIFILLFARVVNRKADALNSLGLATALICINPFAVSDTSAVLSVLSVLGMLAIKPKIDSYLKPVNANKFLLYAYDSFTLTLSIMITTFPAVWVFFSNISFVSYLANIILIPLAQLTMIGSLFISLLGFSKFICIITAVITYIPAKLMLTFADLLASNLGFLTLDVSNEFYLLSYCLIIVLLGLSLVFNRKIKVKALVAVTMSVFILTASLSAFQNIGKTYVNVSSANAVVIYNPSGAVVIGADNASDYYDVRKCLQIAKSDTVIFVDCDYDNDKLSNLAMNNKIFYNNCDFNIDLCEGITVQYQSGVVYAKVNNSNVVINKKYVIVDDYFSCLRKSKYINDNDVDTVIGIRK